LSQKHEGWQLVPTQYDGGGFSGGTMDRPAIKRLLADMEAKKIDIIVVYKVDRLTRSLMDFSKLVELMDKRGVSFVSITQQFNTTTSMGRLTLNVLLSFAQFEREVTGERIRDKIALSKQRGKWMGGMTPLGYDVKEQKLYINDEDAVIIRHIFNRYLVLKSVNLLKEELDADGYTTKQHSFENGKQSGGLPFHKGHLYRLLQNRIYKVNGTGKKAPCMLAGILFDDRGHPMSPKHCRTRKLYYRYYTSQAIISGYPHQAGSLPNIPAHEIERLVQVEIVKFFKDEQQLQPWLQNENIQSQTILLETAQNLSWENTDQERLFLKLIIRRIELSDKAIKIELCGNALIPALRGELNGKPNKDASQPITLMCAVKLEG
jgi:site-specific DNA recombinase